MSEKKYYDQDGNEISLYRLILKHPEWAQSRIEYLQQHADGLEAENKRLRDGIQSIHELLFVSHNELSEDLAKNE